jgi:hypothetical protein
MANFQFWGHQTKNVDFLLTNPHRKIFQIFKSQFRALRNIGATWHTPQKMGNFAKVHLAKKKKESIHGFMVKMSKMCFGRFYLSRLNGAADKPKIGAV